MTSMHQEEQSQVEFNLRSKLREHLGPHINRKGWLLYSGLDTLRRGQYYVMGFNPAVDPANRMLREMPIYPSNWSAYTQQCWRCPGESCDHLRTDERGVKLQRPKPHQKRVSAFLNAVKHRPEDVFATNAIFVESQNAAALVDV